MIITHRPNDYHADHRAAGLLVQAASYILIVPRECPETPAMQKMPVIMYYEDPFSNPVFRPDIVLFSDNLGIAENCFLLYNAQIILFIRSASVKLMLLFYVLYNNTFLGLVKNDNSIFVLYALRTSVIPAFIASRTAFRVTNANSFSP